MINTVTIAGNIVKDPELRSTASGTAVMTFSIAVNERRRNNQTGEWDSYPNFFDCTMFGNRAQGLHPHLSKGQKVCVQGKLRYSSWERDGQKRSKVDIIADDIEFMSQKQQPRQQTGRQGDAQYAQATYYDPMPNYEAQQQGFYDEQIPF